MALLGDGKLRGLPGGVDQYLELRHAAGASASGAKTGPAAKSGPAAAAPGPSEAEKREARKEVNRIERQLGKLAQQAEQLHAQMAESSAADPRSTSWPGSTRGCRPSRRSAGSSRSNGWRPPRPRGSRRPAPGGHAQRVAARLDMSPAALSNPCWTCPLGARGGWT